MLVIHGDKDYRVPISEALRLWWDLSRHGADVEVPLLPRREPLDPQAAATPRVWYETVFAFLAQHVLGDRPELL